MDQDESVKKNPQPNEIDSEATHGSDLESCQSKDDPNATIHSPASGQKSDNIGPYKLLQKLGEGGMGVVWMAEQEKPIRRQVALKLIKAHGSNKQVIARFEAERQALALMDHHHIAKVFDAGTTDGGQPFFVMELVRGIPVTQYCDQNKLSISDRLKLFVPICNAVQHAHQKGIIHRDLKPSNVMVCLYDGAPVPKVIDFGLAKALEHQNKLTDKTMFTEFGQVVGTLQYMSPEQAEMSQLDIDTRTDIYSLGVMLYELLTGSTPIELETLRSSATFKILETIREIEPPRPSARLTSLTHQAIIGVSAQRGLESGKLQHLLRGDLDWIVMKSLEKDRTRRYETAYGFANDIKRYLDNEPIEARPPSKRYRMEKFVSKNKSLVAGVASTLVFLTGGIATSTHFLFQAKTANQNLVSKNSELESEIKLRQSAEASATEALKLKEQAARSADAAKQLADRSESVFDFIIDSFRSVDPSRGGSIDMSAKDILVITMERMTEPKGLLNKDPAARAKLSNALCESFLALGDYKRSVFAGEQARNLNQELFGADHDDTLNAALNLGIAYLRDGRLTQAIETNEYVWNRVQQKKQVNASYRIEVMTTLAETYVAAGRMELGYTLAENANQIADEKLGRDDLETVAAHEHLANIYLRLGDPVRALPLLKETVKQRKAQLGEQDPTSIQSMISLAAAYRASGKPTAAYLLLEETQTANQKKLGLDHPLMLQTAIEIGLVFLASDKPAEAVTRLQQTLRLQQQKLGNDHPDTLSTMSHLAIAFQKKQEKEKELAIQRPVVAAKTSDPENSASDTNPSSTDPKITANAINSPWRQGSQGNQYPGTNYRPEFVPHTTTHMDYVPHSNHIDAVPHATTHYDSNPFQYTLHSQWQPTKDPVDQLVPDRPLLSENADANLTLTLLEKTLKLRREKLGLNHPDTLSSLDQLAQSYLADGQLKTALPLFEESAKLKQSQLAITSPKLLVANRRTSLLATIDGLIEIATSTDNKSDLDKWQSIRKKLVSP